MRKLLSLALTLMASPMLPVAAIAQDCFMTTSSGARMDLGSLCGDSGGGVSAAPVSNGPEYSSVQICNETNRYIYVAISSGTDGDRFTESHFLLTDETNGGDCITRTVRGGAGDSFYVRAWRSPHYNTPSIVHTVSDRSFCFNTFTRSSNAATTEDECDRVAGRNVWGPFEFFRINRDQTNRVVID